MDPRCSAGVSSQPSRPEDGGGILGNLGQVRGVVLLGRLVGALRGGHSRGTDAAAPSPGWTEAPCSCCCASTQGRTGGAAWGFPGDLRRCREVGWRTVPAIMVDERAERGAAAVHGVLRTRGAADVDGGVGRVTDDARRRSLVVAVPPRGDLEGVVTAVHFHARRRPGVEHGGAHAGPAPAVGGEAKQGQRAPDAPVAPIGDIIEWSVASKTAAAAAAAAAGLTPCTVDPPARLAATAASSAAPRLRPLGPAGSALSLGGSLGVCGVLLGHRLGLSLGLLLGGGLLLLAGAAPFFFLPSPSRGVGGGERVQAARQGLVHA